MYVLNEEGMRVHAKIYQEPDAIEIGAIGQLKNAACLPYAFHHVALMPDGHLGYGIPIGAVFASENVISPHMVGLDIGCSMSALKLAIKTEQLTPDIRKTIEANIRKAIPTGFHHHEKRQDATDMPSTSYMDMPIVKQQYESATKQVGTLGGGK
mgnify:CR=1 FL=1